MQQYIVYIGMNNFTIDIFHNAILNSEGFFVNKDTMCICIPSWFPANHIKISPIAMENITIFEEPIFLLYHPWGMNIHHNFMELLPNILLFKEQRKNIPNMRLCVNSQLKYLYVEILQILEIPTSILLPLISNTNYTIVYFPNAMSTYRSYDNSTICKHHYDIFDSIRKYYCLKFQKEIYQPIQRKIYITRRNTGCAGANRYIANNDEVLNYMQKNNFDIIDFTEMSMENKFMSSLHAHVIVSPIGANLVNLYFAKCDTMKHIILLDPVYKGKSFFEYYTKQLRIMCKLDKEVHVFNCEVTQYNGNVHNPYYVDICKLDAMLVSF